MFSFRQKDKEVLFSVWLNQLLATSGIHIRNQAAKVSNKQECWNIQTTMEVSR